MRIDKATIGKMNGEYIVRAWHNLGENQYIRHDAADYFASDLTDAKQTANLMVGGNALVENGYKFIRTNRKG